MQSAALVILIEVSLLKASGKTSVGSRTLASNQCGPSRIPGLASYGGRKFFIGSRCSEWSEVL